jgi:predicted RNA binding protein with dsRBD fold (UPF0201 family)
MEKISISCPVFPSEDPERVRQAVLNIFPDAVFDTEGDIITSGSAGTEHFGSRIRMQRILDTARSVMIKGMRGNRTSFRLNKQAAYAGKISFIEGKAVLGTIDVSIEAEDLEAFIELLAPRTINGEEIRI